MNKKIIVPSWALDLLFYGNTGTLTPNQLKAIDRLLDSLEGYDKTPCDYQNVGLQQTNALNDKVQNCYELVFKGAAHVT